MLEEQFTTAELDDMAAQYASAFTTADGKCVMTAEEAFEEICCDALGGINIFAELDVDLRIDYPVLDTIRSYVSDNESTQSRAPPSDGGEVKYSLEGINKDGIEVYETSEEVKALTRKERQKKFLEIMQNEYRGRTAKFVRNGHTYYAKFDSEDVNKNIYGDKRSSNSGYNAKIKVGADGNIFELVENAKYNGSEKEIGKSAKAHKQIQYWDYYIKTVQIDNQVYDLVANVRRKSTGDFVYSIQLRANNAIEASAAQQPNQKVGVNKAANASVNSISTSTENVNTKFSAEPNAEELQAKINSAMTMSEAKRMIESAFKINGIYSFYDGKYRTADEWLRAEGSSEVELYIENEWSLQEKYINSNEDILDGKYYISDVLDAYLDGTLVGKEKPKAKRFDTSVSYGMDDGRFYSPQRIEQAENLLAVANEKVTSENKEAVNEARAKLLLFAHNKGAAEALGLTQAELNKKLRSWSGYSATAKKLSEAANKGVALENRWTGVENCSYINKARISNEDISELVGSIEGDTNNHERRYIARVMLAADTHINYNGLRFIFESNKAVNERLKNGSGRTKGFFSAGNESVPDTIVCSYNSPDTVAHEMGHYIDVRWGRDLLGKETGSLYLSRGINEDMVRERHGENGVQFMKNFKIFMDSLTNGNSNISSYTNDYAEVFARFFARFVEWVDNTATGNRSYSYESHWYNDNFTASQYVEFIKLLQEKAMLDAKYEAEHSAKFSQEPMTLAQLKAENRKFKKQLEYWRNQTRKNPKKTVREGDIKKLAKAIVESCYTDIKPHEIVPDLMELGNYILNEKELRYTEVHDMAERIATDLIENAISALRNA